MTEFPSWNFWQFMTIDVNSRGFDFRSLVSIYDWVDIVGTDIRNKKFDIDYNKWCREYFWDAGQAALISFDRDPGKIEKYLSEHGGFGADEDNEEECAAHKELVDAITARQELIEEAQESKVLPPGIIRPEMFIDWGKRVGFQVPPQVEKWVNNVERERRGEGRISSIRDTSGKVAGIFFENDDAEDDETHLNAPVNEGELPENEPKQKSKRSVGPESKAEYNSTGVLLAVLMESKLMDREQDELRRNLQTLIEKKKIRTIKGKSISEATVSKRIDDAYALYRNLLPTPKA